MTASTSRGPYSKTAEVRGRILQACMEAFGETGFRGATMKDIAARADISQTGLVHHFPGKEDLLLAMLDLRERRSIRFLESTEALDPGAQPIQALRGMLGVLVENELQPGLMELHCVLSGEATNPDHPAHTHYAERYRNLRQFYEAVFSALAERGELTSPIEPAVLATMTIALINGLQQQWLFDRDSVNVEGAIHTFLLSIIPGLAA
ncbi:TetR/AcrR family transcriptional regulator [Streptomyces sp. NBC_01358]|uniref:TetR/AcrR family transcriptional regulator n=1 Tax=Streptomyces sp. NBC_01358 TaxID=2903837 RepID=UPI002E2FF26D|nr:TetR/AcrR family transcriptional regulator [Streptomyces sp. NBC_01358]